MSTTAAINLPEEFLLHFRSTRKEPWTHYVLVRKTTGADGKYRLTLSPHSTIIVPPTEPAHLVVGAIHQYLWDDHIHNIPLVSTNNAVIVIADFYRNPVTVHVHGTVPKEIPILYTTKYRELLGPRLRANFTPVAFAVSQQVASAPVASPTFTAPIPLTIPSPSAIPSPVPPPLSDTIAHVAAPPPLVKKVKKVPKPQAPPPAPGRGDLAPFVAKQLLALAKLRHDQCPIVAEEYSDGNTAAMPCGHLFAQIAIEESFKKEPNKCPACRAPGRPTYV
jgi:hypothetical protein